MNAALPDLSRNRSPHSLSNKCGRLLWMLVWATLFRTSPKPLFGWRRALLRLFGAKVARTAHPHPSVRIWAPWNLEMGEYSGLGPFVDCYNVARVVLGANATVSQYSFLCTASHDFELPHFPLVASSIVLGPGAWVAADAFIGPGVTLGEGAVVAARSTVVRDVEPWTVVAGNPARFIRARVMRDA